MSTLPARRLLVAFLLPSCFLVATVSCAAAQLQSDDFQSDNEGWIGSFITPPAVQASGGPMGEGDAFLLVSADSPNGPGSNLSTHNSTADWAGSYAELNAGHVSVDLMSPVNSSDLELRLVLFGPQFVSERWTSTVAHEVPNDGEWRNYEFSLTEAELTQVGGTGSYAELMNDVVRVMLRHDSGSPSAGGTPIDASFGIDNVRLVALASAQPGDFDEDGDVDGEDFLVWQRGGSAMPVSAEDLEAWEGNYGSSSGNSASRVGAVPEPANIALLLCYLTMTCSVMRPNRGKQ